MSSLLMYASAYPIATVSSAAFYLLLITLAIPQSRRFVAPFLTHPIPPHQQFLQAFDTFRGFAAVLVAMGHIWWATYPVFQSTQLTIPLLAYGAKAVPMFAVLSGFLIYRSVLSIQSLSDLRAYVIRRFCRIYPVYLLSVVLCLLCGQYVTGPYYTAQGFFISDLLMLKVFSWPPTYIGNPATWSLYVEVPFYVFLPVAVVAL
ncbi:MAG TPA: acyltransferase family protein, partial [Bradyrhizobium sp.]|nr:acyltransferase family protein [Bradyrhizobium sp.]